MRRLALGLVLVCCVGCSTPASGHPMTTAVVTLEVSAWPQVTRMVMPEDLDRCG